MKIERSSEELYEYYEPKAKRWKTIIQFAIAIAIIILMSSNLLLSMFDYIDVRIYTGDHRKLKIFMELHPLQVAGFGLAVAAGIELAYLLFTDGPDESIDPVMLGIASSILLLIAQDDSGDWETALTIAVLVASMIGLFWARERFNLKIERNAQSCSRTKLPPEPESGL